MPEINGENIPGQKPQSYKQESIKTGERDEAFFNKLQDRLTNTTKIGEINNFFKKLDEDQSQFEKSGGIVLAKNDNYQITRDFAVDKAINLLDGKSNISAEALQHAIDAIKKSQAITTIELKKLRDKAESSTLSIDEKTNLNLLYTKNQRINRILANLKTAEKIH